MAIAKPLALCGRWASTGFFFFEDDDDFMEGIPRSGFVSPCPDSDSGLPGCGCCFPRRVAVGREGGGEPAMPIRRRRSRTLHVPRRRCLLLQDDNRQSASSSCCSRGSEQASSPRQAGRPWLLLAPSLDSWSLTAGWLAPTITYHLPSTTMPALAAGSLLHAPVWPSHTCGSYWLAHASAAKPGEAGRRRATGRICLRRR